MQMFELIMTGLALICAVYIHTYLSDRLIKKEEQKQK